jgi:COMPASS component SPP1
MMVECEGGCGDWYHCSCVGLDVEDAKELLDRYVCPKCTIPTKSFTTWKPMCRYYNVGHFLGTRECRKAARVSDDPPSKYCSDEHKEAWFKFFVSRLRQDDEPSKGGALNVDEFKMLAAACMTEDGKLDIERFHALGKKPRLPKKEGADPGKLQSRCVGVPITDQQQSAPLDLTTLLRKKQRSLQS